MIFSDETADEIGHTVCDLVSIKTLSGEEAPAAEYVQTALRKMGLEVERDDQDNVCAVIEPKQKGIAEQNTLHLSGHTDTVVPVEGWATDPWKPEVTGSGDDRKIVGLGTSDMKSGLAIMLHLAKHFAANRSEKLRTIVSFTVCEEMPAKDKRNGVHRMVVSHPGRWALTTEASCDHHCPTIALGCQGHAVVRLTLKGRSAHSASPDRGINAISAASLICRRIDDLNRTFKDIHVLGDVYARAAASVTQIKGGAAGNIIPEHCELTISRRVAPGETKDDVEKELVELTQDLNGVSVRWTLRLDAPACTVETGGPLLKSASEASRKLFNNVRYTWNRARTDMVLFRQAGMDVLNVGPGFTGQAHVAGEYVRLIDLPRSANLVAETMMGLDRYLTA